MGSLLLLKAEVQHDKSLQKDLLSSLSNKGSLESWTSPPAIRLFPNLGVALSDEDLHAVPTNYVDKTFECQPEEEYRIVDSVESPIGALESGKAVDPSWYWRMLGVDVLTSRGFTGTGVTVGILDSGIDEDTADLKKRVCKYAAFDPLGNVDISVRGDAMGHGTQMCSIIASRQYGVAPNAGLVVGRIADSMGITTFAKIVAGLEWILEQKKSDARLRLINLSIGKLDNSPPVLTELICRIERLDILLVAAIGNKGPGTSITPANIVSDAILAVGAVGAGGTVASFSGNCQNGSKPDVVSPGDEIVSYRPGGGVSAASGTSEATALVTGLGALLQEKYQGINANELRQCLLDSCREIEPRERAGRGIPDGNRACPAGRGMTNVGSSRKSAALE